MIRPLKYPEARVKLTPENKQTTSKKKNCPFLTIRILDTMQ